MRLHNIFGVLIIHHTWSWAFGSPDYATEKPVGRTEIPDTRLPALELDLNSRLAIPLVLAFLANWFYATTGRILVISVMWIIKGLERDSGNVYLLLNTNFY